MRRVLALSGALLVLGAPVASAKGISAVEICGASACREVPERSLGAFPASGGPQVPPPIRRSAWYSATVTFRADHAYDSFRLTVVPSQGLMRGEDGSWMQLSFRSVKQIRRAAKGLPPFPASTLSGVSSQPASASGSMDLPDPVQPSSSDPDGGGTPWPWIAAASLALIILGSGGAAFRSRRKRRT
jgi:hypothetical protein